MLRMPRNLPGANKDDTGPGVLETEILAAASLGRAGNAVEHALRALREAEGNDPERSLLLKKAAAAVYAYLVQRELMGLRVHDGVIREYAIPGEVIARLGATA